MKYVVVMKESGTGCDYMIGCGIATLEIDVPDGDDPAVAAVRKVADEFGPFPNGHEAHPRNLIASVVVYPKAAGIEITDAMWEAGASTE